MIIYKTINLINNKIYIGQSLHDDPNYLGSGKLLHHAIKKYGKENFKKEILELCDDINILDEREKFWIKELNAQNKEIGYNILEGGQKRMNTFLPEETRKLISERVREWNSNNLEFFKNRIYKDVSGEKNPMYNKGWKVSGNKNGRFGGNGTTDETRRKISESKIGLTFKMKDPTHQAGEKNSMYGTNAYKKWIEKFGQEIADIKREEWKNKISKAGKKRIWTEESKRKISESKKGWKPSKETIQRQKETKLKKKLLKLSTIS